MPFDMKEMISNQLKELLKHKSLDKITVKELVTACHISRQTFYYHFQDIMDVVEWQQKQVLEESVRRSLAAPDPQKGIREMVRESAENRELLSRLLNSRHRAEIERLLVKMVYAYLGEMLCRQRPDKKLTPADADAVLRFYSSGIVGLLLNELETKERDEDMLAQQMYRILTGDLTLD